MWLQYIKCISHCRIQPYFKSTCSGSWPTGDVYQTSLLKFADIFSGSPTQFQPALSLPWLLGTNLVGDRNKNSTATFLSDLSLCWAWLTMISVRQLKTSISSPFSASQPDSNTLPSPKYPHHFFCLHSANEVGSRACFMGNNWAHSYILANPLFRTLFRSLVRISSTTILWLWFQSR